jgi:hypothetical protein
MHALMTVVNLYMAVSMMIIPIDVMIITPVLMTLVIRNLVVSMKITVTLANLETNA